jgi:hypothetical protein
MVEHLGISEARQCPRSAKLWTACGNRIVRVIKLSRAPMPLAGSAEATALRAKRRVAAQGIAIEPGRAHDIPLAIHAGWVLYRRPHLPLARPGQAIRPGGEIALGLMIPADRCPLATTRILNSSLANSKARKGA